MRRVTFAVGLNLLVDGTLYLAVIPLLPYYAARFDLSKVEVGMLVAAFPIAIAAASLPVALLAGRVSGRGLVIAAGVLFTISTVLFAFAPSAPMLGAARLLQGVASAVVWTAGMAWATASAPADEQGAVSGQAMSMNMLGAIAGPSLGVLAGATSAAIAFTAAAVGGVASTIATISAPAGAALAPTRGLAASIRRLLHVPFMIAALLIATIDALVLAFIDVLAPLELGARGLTTTRIGAIYVTGAAVGVAVGPFAGRLIDRVGAGRVGLGAGVVVCLLTLALAPVPSTWVIVAVLLLVNPVFVILAAAQFPLAGRAAVAAGTGEGAAFALLAVVFGTGFTIGPIVGGAIAEAAGDGTAYLAATIVGAILLCAFWVVDRRAESALSD